MLSAQADEVRLNFLNPLWRTKTRIRADTPLVSFISSVYPQSLFYTQDFSALRKSYKLIRVIF